MGRTRSFDESTVVSLAAERFRIRGYEATSLEDLLQATGLHRGSLYQAFGSKRGLFVAALNQVDAVELTDFGMDLLLVALLELAPVDSQVRVLVEQLLLQAGEPNELARQLGHRLMRRAHIDLEVDSTGEENE